MLSTKKDIQHRKALAWTAHKKLEKIWSAAHISVKLKIDILRASVFSILLYGSETWILSRDLTNQLNSFATRCYRKILGISYLEHITNEEVYSRVEQKPLAETIHLRQLTWVGHALRRPANEPSRIFALYEPTHGRPKRGQPTINYLNYIGKLLNARGLEGSLNENEIASLAQNRKCWDRILKTSPLVIN